MDGSQTAARSRAALIYALSQREVASASPRARRPEPMVYEAPSSVEAFDAAGAEAGPLRAFYEASARSVSRLLPEGGTVLEIGCGSGRSAAHLALRRTDAIVIGIDLAEPMLERGRALMQTLGLAARVTLRQADMTELDACGPIAPAVVMASLSLHHLPNAAHLDRCLSSVAHLIERCGCALWLFDFARLRDPHSYRDLLVSRPDITGALREDALASEAAAWTEDELSTALCRADVHCRTQVLSPLPLLQSHWRGSETNSSSGHQVRWSAMALPHEVLIEADAIDRQLGVRVG
jgi:tRNA (cmo5U34)-methyltransferase